jgi:hypothetical protein
MSDLRTYTVSFARVGRNHSVRPLEITSSEDADYIAERIHRYARQYLASRDVEVMVDLDKMTGSIFCGFNSGGTFTIAASGGAS